MNSWPLQSAPGGLRVGGIPGSITVPASRGEPPRDEAAKDSTAAAWGVMQQAAGVGGEASRVVVVVVGSGGQDRTRTSFAGAWWALPGRVIPRPRGLTADGSQVSLPGDQQQVVTLHEPKASDHAAGLAHQLQPAVLEVACGRGGARGGGGSHMQLSGELKG